MYVVNVINYKPNSNSVAVHLYQLKKTTLLKKN